MKTNAEKLLERLEITYSNIYNLLDAIAKSGDSGKEALIDIKTNEGHIRQIAIKSFKQIYDDLRRFEENFNQLTSRNVIDLNVDGRIKTYKRNISNVDYIESFNFQNLCKVDDNSTMFENFAFPLVKLPIQLDKKLSLSKKIIAKIYEVQTGFEHIKDSIKEIELHSLIKNGTVIANKSTREIPISKRPVSLFGKFNIESIQAKGYDNVRLKLNTLHYGSRNGTENNILLKADDILIYDNSKILVIQDVIFSSNEIIVKEESGGALYDVKVGVGNLQFEQKIVRDSEPTEILFPVKPNQKLVCFFSTETDNLLSFPSDGLKIDTTDFLVSHEGVSYTIDEFYSKFVFNFSEYLKGIMSDSNIPFMLGVKPDKPVLNPNNFKVVQINKHLIDSKTKAEIEKLNKQKQSIQNEIDYRETIVKKTQNEIDTQKFNSIEEKSYLQNRIVTLREEINVFKANLLTIVRDIDTYATREGIKSVVPKYRIIGYWEVQEPMYSPKTSPQNIIKYEVLYRYLTKGVDTIETTSFKMIDKGREINVAFSNWIQCPMKMLNRVVGFDGKYRWEENNVENVDDININQCSISINEAESVEIKIRAISEAGYPLSPVKSDWSEIIRIDFPDYLKDSNVRNNVEKNSRDLATAEFNQLLISSGLMQHINGQIFEGEKLFYHHAKDISSGQYTNEQKNIPLDVLLNTILQDINRLKGLNQTNIVSISFINEQNEHYVISNNTTLNVFAGNYSDEIDSVNPEKFGSIIRKKFYISIKNNSSEPIELRSLVSNSESYNSSDKGKFWGVPVIINGQTKQKHQQILYFRNRGLYVIQSETDSFISTVTEATPTRPNQTNIKPHDSEPNIYVTTEAGDSYELIGLIDSKQTNDFVGFTKEIDSIISKNQSGDISTELKRLASFGDLLSKENKQLSTVDSTSKDELKEYENAPIGFREIDLYSVGKNTCGAWLYPLIEKPESFIINGETTTSFMLIEPNNEILIPIIFEYRMTDRLGNLYSLDETKDALALNLEYRKKLGISMKLNTSEFNFDIQFNAKYRSKISTLDGKNVSKLAGAYNNETKETLN